MALTKIGTDGIKDDAVTSDKVANAINSAIAANTAKTSLEDESVTLAKLEHGTSSNDGKFLRANNGADPTFETINVPAGVGGATGVDFNDDVKARFGTGNDLEIYHDSYHYIKGTTANSMLIQNSTANIHLQPVVGENALKAIANGAVELFHDHNKKLETTSTGINVTGGIRVGGNNAANELDDYEEGTFSGLHFLNGWGYTGDGSNANNGPVTGSHSTGRYTKIGDIVYIHFRVNVGSVSSTTGNQIHMGYPPFYADATYDRQELGFFLHNAANSGQDLFVTTKATSKYYFGFHYRTSSGTGNFTGNNGGTSFDITVNGFYRVE